MIFLDTNICIYALKGKFPAIIKHIRKLTPESISIPSIVKAELMFGASKSMFPEKTKETVRAFLLPYPIVPFDDSATEIYGNLRYNLEKKGTTIGPNDLIIAATVLSHKGSLVTHNTKEFSRIPNLKIKDWTK